MSYEIIYVAGETTLIASDFDKTNYIQGEIVSIPVIVYNPNSLTTEVNVYVDNTLVSTMNVDRTRFVWAKTITTISIRLYYNISFIVAAIVIGIVLFRQLNKDTSESVIVPNFVGMTVQQIEEQYPDFNFKTELRESADIPAGTVIAQDITEGTIVFEERSITLRISNGKEVPDVLGNTLKDAVSDLKAAGFKKIETVAGNVADRQSDSMKVYSVVCEDSKTDNWVAIPDDRRLSVSDKIIVYYYGEYVEETTEETTEEILEDEPVVEEDADSSEE